MPAPSHWIAAKRTAHCTSQQNGACHTESTPDYLHPRQRDAVAARGDEANGETTSEPQRPAEELEETGVGSGEQKEADSMLHKRQARQTDVLRVLHSHRKRNGRKLCSPLHLEAFRLDVVPQGVKREREGSPSPHANVCSHESTGMSCGKLLDAQEHVPEQKVVEKVVTIVPFAGLGECAVSPPTFSQAPFLTSPLSDTETQATFQDDDAAWRQQVPSCVLSAAEQHNTQQWASQPMKATGSQQKQERYSEVTAKLERFQPITFNALVSYFNIQELRAICRQHNIQTHGKRGLAFIAGLAFEALTSSDAVQQQQQHAAPEGRFRQQGGATPEQPAPLSQTTLTQRTRTDDTAKARMMSALKEQIFSQASAQLVARPTTNIRTKSQSTRATEPVKAAPSPDDIFETVVVIRKH